MGHIINLNSRLDQNKTTVPSTEVRIFDIKEKTGEAIHNNIIFVASPDGVIEAVSSTDFPLEKNVDENNENITDLEFTEVDSSGQGEQKLGEPVTMTKEKEATKIELGSSVSITAKELKEVESENNVPKTKVEVTRDDETSKVAQETQWAHFIDPIIESIKSSEKLSGQEERKAITAIASEIVQGALFDVVIVPEEQKSFGVIAADLVNQERYHKTIDEVLIPLAHIREKTLEKNDENTETKKVLEDIKTYIQKSYLTENTSSFYNSDFTSTVDKKGIDTQKYNQLVSDMIVPHHSLAPSKPFEEMTEKEQKDYEAKNEEFQNASDEKREKVAKIIEKLSVPMIETTNNHFQSDIFKKGVTSRKNKDTYRKAKLRDEYGNDVLKNTTLPNATGQKELIAKEVERSVNGTVFAYLMSGYTDSSVGKNELVQKYMETMPARLISDRDSASDQEEMRVYIQSFIKSGDSAIEGAKKAEKELTKILDKYANICAEASPEKQADTLKEIQNDHTLLGNIFMDQMGSISQEKSLISLVQRVKARRNSLQNTLKNVEIVQQEENKATVALSDAIASGYLQENADGTVSSIGETITPEPVEPVAVVEPVVIPTQTPPIAKDTTKTEPTITQKAKDFLENFSKKIGLKKDNNKTTTQNDKQPKRWENVGNSIKNGFNAGISKFSQKTKNKASKPQTKPALAAQNSKTKGRKDWFQQKSKTVFNKVKYWNKTPEEQKLLELIDEIKKAVEDEFQNANIDIDIYLPYAILGANGTDTSGDGKAYLKDSAFMDAFKKERAEGLVKKVNEVLQDRAKGNNTKLPFSPDNVQLMFRVAFIMQKEKKDILSIDDIDAGMIKYFDKNDPDAGRETAWRNQYLQKLAKMGFLNHDKDNNTYEFVKTPNNTSIQPEGDDDGTTAPTTTPAPSKTSSSTETEPAPEPTGDENPDEDADGSGNSDDQQNPSENNPTTENPTTPNPTPAQSNSTTDSQDKGFWETLGGSLKKAGIRSLEMVEKGVGRSSVTVEKAGGGLLTGVENIGGSAFGIVQKTTTSLLDVLGDGSSELVKSVGQGTGVVWGSTKKAAGGLWGTGEWLVSSIYKSPKRVRNWITHEDPVSKEIREAKLAAHEAKPKPRWATNTASWFSRLRTKARSEKKDEEGNAVKDIKKEEMNELDAIKKEWKEKRGKMIALATERGIKTKEELNKATQELKETTQKLEELLKTTEKQVAA